MKQKFNYGGAISPHSSTDKGSTFNKSASSSSEQSANSGGYNQGNQSSPGGPMGGNYDPNKNKAKTIYSSYTNDKGNTSTSTTSNDGSIDDNKNKSSAGNELSMLDQISEENFQKDEYKKRLQLAEDKKNKKKRIWGLDKWSQDNLNGGSVDTSDGVVDDVLNLKEATDKMMKLLGLDPTEKKSMRIALNYLSNDQWGSQTKLRNSGNAAAIDKLVKEGPDGKWKTWGTRLRGDAAWKGVGPMDKDTYSEKLGQMAANVEAGTIAWDYQRALINSHKPLKSEGSLSDLIGSVLFPGLTEMSKSKTGGTIIDWLNSHNRAGEIGIDENGIFDFEMYGDKININGGKDFDDFGIDFKDYIIEEKSAWELAHPELFQNYQTYSFDNTGVVDDEEEDEEEEETEVVYDYDDENPAWWDMTLFTQMFSGKFDKKSDVVTFGTAKEGGIVRKK